MEQTEKNTRKFMEKGEKSKEQNLFNNYKEKTAGITLIALVVTIIVLLILARNFYIDAYR